MFDLVRGPAATIAAQVRWRGLLVVAVDGTLLPVPDTPANLTVFAKQRCNHGSGGYPQVRLAALVAWGTRAVIGAVFPSAATAELEYAGRLAGDLRAGMLLLGDRNFAAVDLAGADKSSTQVGRLITDLWFSSTFTPRVFTCAGPGGIMICRAAASGLPRRDQSPGVPTSRADEPAFPTPTSPAREAAA
ncbi:hypothetical protein ACFYOY_48240 [Streptomyces sp. NPDC007875]|uniref:hypothetical protein n=1 Tax=Streptomyces sp. NPDC007875 TaxID=3364783 RepID=UPI0036CD1BA9